MYFPDGNSEKYPGILYPGDMTVYRRAIQCQKSAGVGEHRGAVCLWAACQNEGQILSFNFLENKSV